MSDKAGHVGGDAHLRDGRASERTRAVGGSASSV